VHNSGPSHPMHKSPRFFLQEKQLGPSLYYEASHFRMPYPSVKVTVTPTVRRTPNNKANRISLN
jgi:hypothetical protein